MEDQTIDTKARRAAHAGATKGKWNATYTYHGTRRFGAVKVTKGPYVCETLEIANPQYTTDGNAAFMADAHEHYPAMCDEIDRLQALERAVEEYCASCPDGGQMCRGDASVGIPPCGLAPYRKAKKEGTGR